MIMIKDENIEGRIKMRKDADEEGCR